MNYRHIYHAGNFADIFKHIILTLCLEKLREKPAPFFVLDTHGGIGKYDLSDERSIKTGEAEEGIKKYLKNGGKLPQSYLEILAQFNHCKPFELNSRFFTYPGSPLIIKKLIRANDRATITELNHEEFSQLKKNVGKDERFFIQKTDGLQLLKSKLPPIEKRGLIFIDPAFEKDQSPISADYEKIIVAMNEAKKRFAHGIYVIWYPIIKGEEKLLENFYSEFEKMNFDKLTRLVCSLKKEDPEQKMTSCGAIIINAPWQLEEKMQDYLTEITKILSN